MRQWARITTTTQASGEMKRLMEIYAKEVQALKGSVLQEVRGHRHRHPSSFQFHGGHCYPSLRGSSPFLMGADFRGHRGRSSW